MCEYIFAADCYCEDCGAAICEELIQEGKAPADFDERTYDSDQFPKGPYDVCERDCIDHCASGPDCLNAIEIGGMKFGVCLENELTTEGVRWLKEIMEESPTDITEYWAELYREYL